LEQVTGATCTSSDEFRILKAQNTENREYLYLVNNQEHNSEYRRNNYLSYKTTLKSFIVSSRLNSRMESEFVVLTGIKLVSVKL